MKKKKEKLINIELKPDIKDIPKIERDKSFMDAVIRGVYKFFESPFKNKRGN